MLMEKQTETVVDATVRQAELQEKHSRVLRFLEAERLDGVWLARRSNFAWYTGGGDSHVIEDYAHGEAGLLIFHDGAYLITNNIEAQRLTDEETPGLACEVVTCPWHDPEKQRRRLASLVNGRRIGADLPLPGFNAVDVSDTFATLRLILTSAEQARYRVLCRECGEILEHACRAVEPGKTEREIAAGLFRQCHMAGITPVVVLVGADERVARYRHPLPKDNPVNNYAMLVLVGVRAGLQAALTRLVAVGGVPPDIIKKHEAVTRIEAIYIHHTRPGATLGHVLEVGMTAYADAGYPDEWQRHWQGGLIGYAPREVEAVPGLDTVVEPYQAAAWLPSISGTKSEDTFLILPDRNEMLTNTTEWPMLPIAIESWICYRPDILRL